MGYYGFGYYFDPTYFLVLIGAVLCIWAQARVSSTYSKYSKVLSRRSGFCSYPVFTMCASSMCPGT